MIVTLTARDNMQPVPRVEVRIQELGSVDGGAPATSGAPPVDGGTPSSTSDDVDGGTAGMTVVQIPASTTKVTVWRSDEQRRMRVRSAINVPFSGSGFSVLDREPGRGSLSSYELECLSDDGSSTTVGIGSVLMPAPQETWQTVIQQPLNPALAVIVEERKTNVDSVTRRANADLVETEGGTFPRLVGFGPRQGLSKVTLDLIAPTREAAAALWRTLGDEATPQLPVWLVRSMHPLLPRVFFCEVLDLQEVDVDLHVGGTRSRFIATVTEVSAPAPALSVPSLRYSDLAAAFGTYSAIAAALPRYPDWASAWEYAGAAG